MNISSSISGFSTFNTAPISSPSELRKLPNDGNAIMNTADMAAHIQSIKEEAKLHLEKQEAATQNTVIRKGDEVIATFGDNGYKLFFNGSDGGFVKSGEESIEQIIEAMQKKYNNQLTVERYDLGEGPSSKSILDEKYSNLPKSQLHLLA